MSNYLSHRKGEERENHKYVARVLLKKGSGRKPNLYRYFYDKEKYQAYLKGKQNQQNELAGQNGLQSKGLTSFIKNIGNNIEDKTKDLKNTISTTISKGEEISKKFIGKEGVKSIKDIDTKDIEKIGYDTLLFGLKTVVTSKLYEGYIDLKEKVKPFETKKNDTPADTKQRAEDAMVTPKEQKEREQFPDLKVKEEGFTNEEDMNLINPKYHTMTYDYCMNCSYCTAAYDMRQRGFDVEAAPINEYRDDPTTIDELASWYKDADVKTCDDIDEVLTTHAIVTDAADMLESQLKENGEGSRGFLCLYWTGGGGHAVAWEVENGEVVIRDCQTNEVVDAEYYLDMSSDIEYFRTDNLELSDEIRKVVRNRT